MQIVLAGAAAAGLVPIVGEHHRCRLVAEPLQLERLPRPPVLLISFGYRHIVSPDVLAALGGNAVNLHVSLLPWNRGADPNLWSWLEGTPKGVTIHWMAAGLDRGEVITQRRVHLDTDHTLRSSYEALQSEIIALFAEIWPRIERGDAPRLAQRGRGTYHRSSDKSPHLGALTSGWDTSCGEVEHYGRRMGLWIGDARSR